jgi:hypothetical protein
MKHYCSKTWLLPLVFSILAYTKVVGQNIGIGVTNPQKGKLEISGALGGHTTVLTIGSDGAGISLQRNWPTIGFNQYRDASNTQRFIGAGHAGSIFVSSVDGSIVFSQFGQGTANQEITSATYPLVINGFGNTVVNGIMNLKNNLQLEKDLVFTNTPKVVSNQSGITANLLPFAYGHIKSDGSRFRGTSNFTSAYNAGLTGYLIYFTENGDDAQVVVTPRAQVPLYATYSRISQGIMLVTIWNKDGVKTQSDFSFTVFQ